MSQQLSIYSALDLSDETGYNLLFKVDKSDINTKFERQADLMCGSLWKRSQL